MSGPTAPLGYYWGEDAYGVSHGPDALGKRIAEGGAPLERIRVSGSSTTHAEISEKVATATLFGGGSLVVVAEPAALVATKPLQARMAETIGAVAPGNALAFLDTVDGTQKRPGSRDRRRQDAAPARRSAH